MNSCAFRSAGEFLGLLWERLGFGELSLSIETSGPLTAARYDWRFDAGGERFGVSQVVSFAELETMVYLAAAADALADTWRRMAPIQLPRRDW